MSATKLYTERDMVLAKREAFRAGADYGSTTMTASHAHEGPCFICDKRAAERYPLPKVTRPRVVKDEGGIAWRLFDGYLQWQGHSNWRKTQDYNGMAINEHRIRLWADLLANPTEEVEDDG